MSILCLYAQSRAEHNLGIFMLAITQSQLPDFQSQLSFFYNYTKKLNLLHPDVKLSDIYNAGAQVVGYKSFTDLKHNSINHIDLAKFHPFSNTHYFEQFINHPLIKLSDAHLPDEAVRQIRTVFERHDDKVSWIATEAINAHQGLIISFPNKPSIDQYTNSDYQQYLKDMYEYDFCCSNGLYDVNYKGSETQTLLLSKIAMCDFEAILFQNIAKLRLSYTNPCIESFHGVIANAGYEEPTNLHAFSEDLFELCVGYFELHNKTDRALFSGEQFKYLRYLAGSCDMPKVLIENDDYLAAVDAVDMMIERAIEIKRTLSNSNIRRWISQ